MASSIAAAFKLPDDYVPPTKPPSARPPETRKSQLLRSYTSLLRSAPLILLFQHNNITTVEWSALRRELKAALAEVPPPTPGPSGVLPIDLAPHVKIQVARTRMFHQALKILEFYDPSATPAPPAEDQGQRKSKKHYTHDLSLAAYEAVKAAEKEGVSQDSAYAQIAPLLVGPIALLTMPAVSPAHLAAALSVLAPQAPAFPAPTRKKRPGYYDPAVQSALQKMLLLGGRVENKAFDSDGVRWVGGIAGGLEGLRGQVVSMLQNAGLSLTSALEGTSKSLYFTMSNRQTMLEDAEKGEGEGGDKKE